MSLVDDVIYHDRDVDVEELRADLRWAACRRRLKITTMINRVG